MPSHHFLRLFRAAALLALLGAVSPAFGLPALPPFPAPEDFVKHDPLHTKDQEDALSKMLATYNLFARVELPRLIESCKDSAQRTAAGDQYCLRSADGKKLLFLGDNSGSVNQVNYYEFADDEQTRINPDRSYSLGFYNRIMVFKTREGRNLGVALDGAPHLDAFTNVTTPDKSFEANWDKAGTIIREETVTVKRTEAAPAPASFEFLKPLELNPAMGSNEPIQDPRLAQELKVTLEDCGEDLREMSRLTKAGRMEYSLDQDKRLVGRCLAPDHKKFVALALSPEKPPRLIQAEITHYDINADIPESYTRRASVQFQEKSEAVGLYSLHLPDRQIALSFDDLGRLRAFNINWPAKSERRGFTWDERGRITVATFPADAPPADAK